MIFQQRLSHNPWMFEENQGDWKNGGIPHGQPSCGASPDRTNNSVIFGNNGKGVNQAQDFID
jgi:hypothetical protein